MPIVTASKVAMRTLAATTLLTKLHGVAGADIAAVEDVRADGLENRLDARIDVGRRADHDGDGAGVGAVRAAADGRVDQRDARLGEVG